jgi:hypothetical protein
MRGGARGAYTPIHHHMKTLAAQGASTPTRGVPSLYVWTLWRCCYGCCCADRLRWHGVVVVTTTRRRRSWSTTFSTLTRNYIGPLLQLFFCCSTHLVVMVYDLLLVSFLGWHSRCSVSIAYSYPNSVIRAVLQGPIPPSRVADPRLGLAHPDNGRFQNMQAVCLEIYYI